MKSIAWIAGTVFFAAWAACACDNVVFEGDPDASGDTDTDADADTDVDSDSDSDADGDGGVGCAEPMAQVAWVRGIGGIGHDGVQQVIELADGTIIATGSFQYEATFDGATPDEITLYDEDGFDWEPGGASFLAAYSPSGDLLWARILSNFPLLGWMFPTPDGDFLMIGHVIDEWLYPFEEEPVPIPADVGDAYVARLSADGNVQWLRTVTHGNAEPGIGFIYSARALPSGITYVTGDFTGWLSLGQGDPDQITISGGLERRGFVAALEADGTILWAHALPLTNGQCGPRVIAPDGSLFQYSWFWGIELFGEGGSSEQQLISMGGSDGFVARYGTSGELSWAKRFGGLFDDWYPGGGEAAADGDGSLVVAGSFADGAVFALGEPNETVLDVDVPDTEPADEQDAFLARYRSNGALDWAVKIPGEPLRKTASTVAVRANDQIAVGGQRGELGLLLDGFSPGGEHCWSAVGTATECDQCNMEVSSVVYTPDAPGLIAAGQFNGVATFGQDWPGETTLTQPDDGADDEPSDGFLLRLVP